MRRFLVAAAGAAASGLVALPWPAAAQGLDLSKGGPVDVTAQDGMEWRQNEQMVIARGDARATRGGVTVTADTLIARYRRKAVPGGAPGAAGAAKGAATGAATPAAATVPDVAGPGTGTPATGQPGGPDTGANEIYRLEAEGHVRIFTATDLAVADHAVYDIDSAVLLLTGKNLTVTTPQQVMTARDTMEYWSQKHMAVGRGDASVTTTDGRRVTADVLVGYTKAPAGSPGAAPGAVPAAAGDKLQPGKPAADPTGASGKLERVEGFGNVVIRTAVETARGDRGVYVADTGIARLAGHVRITRGQNQLDGDEALVNMRTGISTLVRDPGGRVQGLVVPNDSSTAKAGGGTAGAKPSTPPPPRP